MMLPDDKEPFNYDPEFDKEIQRQEKELYGDEEYYDDEWYDEWDEWYDEEPEVPEPEQPQTKPAPQESSYSILTTSPDSVFKSYTKDPRLDASITKSFQKAKKSQFKTTTLLWEKLKKYNEEDFLNELRLHKKKQIKQCLKFEADDPLKNRPRILKMLSDLADEITMTAMLFMNQKMEQQFGLPAYLSSYQQLQESHLALLAMGKWGGHEINYYSDLDLIFVYSHQGRTKGATSIQNQEYFSKWAQKFLTSLSVSTATGICYDVDTELRPSGNQGLLVTPYDKFIHHQMNKAADWERQALLRARPVCFDFDFMELLTSQIQNLNYKRPLNKTYFKDMHDIRMRVIEERAQSASNSFDLKLGAGGIMDIEFVAHALQLKMGGIHPNLQTPNIFKVLMILNKESILKDETSKMLVEAYTLFRTLESKLHLSKQRSASLIHFENEDLHEWSQKLGFKNKDSLVEKLKELKDKVHAYFLNTFMS